MIRNRKKLMNKLLDESNGSDELMRLYEKLVQLREEILETTDAREYWEAILRAKRTPPTSELGLAAELQYSGFEDEDETLADNDPDSELLPSERFFASRR